MTLNPGQIEIITTNSNPEISLGGLLLNLDKYKRMDSNFPLSLRNKLEVLFKYQSEQLNDQFSVLFNSTLKQMLLSECDEALKDFKKTNRMLYRGADNDGPMVSATVIYPRADRKPMSTHPMIAEYYDVVYDSIGAKAKRSNSLFCTSNEHQAASYGAQTFIVIPFNGYECSWSPKVSDAFTSSMYMYLDKKKMFEIGEKCQNMSESLFNRLFPNNDYNISFVHRKTLSDKTDSLISLLFNSRTYSNIEQLSKYLKQALPELSDPKSWFIEPTEYAKKIELTTGNLDKALLHRNEVMIKGQCMLINMKYKKFIKGIL